MKKWLVSNFYEPEEVLVINNGEGTEYYTYDENIPDFFKKEDDDHFFSTLEEAQAYWDREIKPLFGDKTKRFIEHLFERDRFDMFPGYVKDWKKSADKYFNYKEREIIRNALAGRICIEATTFSKEEVKRVEYGKEYKIVLRDGHELKTSSEIERFIIESIFGGNTSGRKFVGF